VVLLKEVRAEGFVFYSNYKSQKGRDMEANRQVALNFFWPSLERQVRVQGMVEKVSAEESDAYFKSRPYKSQVGAWASEQSAVIDGRAEIVKRFALFAAKHLTNVPRPPHWGGYLVKPTKIEFWQGRSSRLHDRFSFSFSDGQWRADRLAP
jgi:pyridoxamine 5'-phosphate oxidase